MKGKSTRVILYISDIQKLSNTSYKASRYLYAKIKKKYNASVVSVDAFCEYAGMKRETMERYLDETD